MGGGDQNEVLWGTVRDALSHSSPWVYLIKTKNASKVQNVHELWVQCLVFCFETGSMYVVLASVCVCMCMCALKT